MKKKLSTKEIDELVVLNADQDEAWEKWTSVNPSKAISIRLSDNTISSLKTLAKLRNEKGYQTLIKKWIDERLIYEQRVLRGIKEAYL